MIVCSGLRLQFGKRIAIHDLNITLDAGVTAVLGPNGAGKTSLIRILATATKPTSGSVSMNDERLVGRRVLRAHRRRLGYMPQASLPAVKHLTVRQFLSYVAYMREVPTGDADQAVEDCLEAVGLSDRAMARMESLSGGMLRRVSFAQSVVNKPALLLLDEPTAGLDPQQRTQLRSLIARQGKDATVLISTHLADDVALTATRVLVLNEGRLFFDGSPDELASEGDGANFATALEAGYLDLLARAVGV